VSVFNVFQLSSPYCSLFAANYVVDEWHSSPSFHGYSMLVLGVCKIVVT
jgi:hypothetical protein